MSDFDDDESAADGVSMEDAVSVGEPLPFKKWRISHFYDYVEETGVDYESLSNLNESIRKARVALFRMTDAINSYEREETAAKKKYEHQWRRAYFKSSDKTDSARKTRADLLCEEYEDKYVVAGQLKSELVRAASAVRLELQTLQAIGNNLRQQLKMEE